MEEVISRIHEGETEVYNNSFNKDNLLERSMYNYIFGIDIKTHNKTSYMFYYIASNTDLIN